MDSSLVDEGRSSSSSSSSTSAPARSGGRNGHRSMPLDLVDQKPPILPDNVPRILHMQSVMHQGGPPSSHPPLHHGGGGSSSSKPNMGLYNSNKSGGGGGGSGSGSMMSHHGGVSLHHHQSSHHMMGDPRGDHDHDRGGGGGSSGSGDEFSPDEDPVKKRREILARRPSYRKIFTELPGSELADEKEGSPSSDSQDDMPNTSSSHHVGVTLSGTGFGTHVLKVIPASAIQMSGGGGGGQGHQIISGSGGGQEGGGSATVVQYRQNQDGSYFVPVSMSPSDLQGYALQGGQGSGSSLSPSSMVLGPGGVGASAEILVEEASRKREVRLMKNREAARECRRKKKEYIKCLESRVAVLETQNKALIDELKTLKELYCQKGD